MPTRASVYIIPISERLTGISGSSIVRRSILAPVEVALLPGLDGTGRLFGAFLAELASSVTPRTIAYPRDEPRGYDDLVDFARDRIPADCRMLIAESFSGPIAIHLAAGDPGRFDALILVATFARSPAPQVLGALPWRWILRKPPSLWVATRLLTGGDADVAQAVRDANRTVRPEVLAHRMRNILRVDVRDALRICPAPVLCLVPSRDRLISRRHSQEIAAVAPRATLVEVPGPHLLLQCSPARCWLEIERFLAANRAP